MNDPLLKRIEIRFRLLLMRALGTFVGRDPAAFPSGFDFNRSKILFVRQDMIGDVLVSTPLFSLLKERYPHAIVDVLLSTKNHFVLQRSPYIRRRWVYTKGIVRTIFLLREIRRERYDVLVDLMDNPSATSTSFCLLAGARWNIGLEKENDFAYNIRVPMLSRRDSHIVKRIARLLTPFGIDVDHQPLTVRYDVADESRKFAEEFLRSREIRKGAAIGVNISAGTDVRFWGIDHFRNLSDRISLEFPSHPVVILYKPEDRLRAESIALSDGPAILAPVTRTFDQFGALISMMGLLVTPDTSAVHLAAAFGIPVVAMYVQSDKSLRIWEPYGSEYEAIVTDVDDLSTISVDRVMVGVRRFCQPQETAHGSKVRSRV
jgi:ADP-heptose:LPS heptosyltransferase